MVNDYEYLVWAYEEKKKDALLNHVVVTVCELERLINKFDAKQFHDYNKIKNIVDGTLTKLAKIKGRK